MHNLAKFSAEPGKGHFEGLINILRYIRDNRILGRKAYADTNDAPVTDLLRQAGIKTEHQFMAFSDCSWQDCPDTGRSTEAYIIFYQCWTIDYGTYVTIIVDQSSEESE